MWYAIGYDEVLGPDGQPAAGHVGMWRQIAGPNTNVRACSLALGKALVSARGAATRLRSAYTTVCIVHEDDLPLYSIFPDNPKVEQGAFLGGIE